MHRFKMNVDLNPLLWLTDYFFGLPVDFVVFFDAVLLAVLLTVFTDFFSTILAGLAISLWLLRAFTIFCSSIRKARMIRSRKHPWHKTPPYVRATVFCRLDKRERSQGRVGRMPFNFSLHCPHLGTLLFFFTYWYTKRPPGVRTMRLLLDLVL